MEMRVWISSPSSNQEQHSALRRLLSGRGKSSAGPQNELLLISDGQDNNSRYTFNELRRLLKSLSVVLYGVGILSGGDSGSALGMEGQGILDELASVSGGKAFPRSAWKWTTFLSRLLLSCDTSTRSGTNPAIFPTMASGGR